MRIFLWILIILISLLAISFGIFLSCSNITFESKVSNTIQLIAAIAALLTALIALLISIPKQKKVNVGLTWFIDKDHFEEYDDNLLSEDLKKHFLNYTKPLKSQRVIFKFKNNSSFDFKKPIFSFKIPQQFAHPSKDNTVLQLRSNLYNTQQELFLLDTSDYHIISNNILPYLNKDDEIEIWIRMILLANRMDSFELTIFVNCENADGFSKKIKLA